MYRFIMSLSNPASVTDLPLVQAAMILLLMHPLISNPERFMYNTKVPLRSVLLQVIGRCVRRAQRAGSKTLGETLPHLLPHFTDSSVMQSIVLGLQKDLLKRFAKFESAALLYNDAITNNLLSVFDLFYLINEAFDAIGYSGRISASTFYFHPLRQFIDVKDDYIHWRNLEEARTNSSQTTQTSFAFCHYPWIFDLEAKGELLRSTGGIRMRHQLQDAFFRAIFDGVQCPYLVLSVRRDFLLADSLAQLDGRPEYDLTKQLKVEFVGEEGVDEGGLRKEFFQLCWDKLFNGDYGIFQELSDARGCFWFRPHGDVEECRLVGILLGLAVYNGILVQPRFPLFLFKKLLKWPVTLDDYREVDARVVHSLEALKSCPVEELGLTFVAGELETELVVGGSELAVNNSNFGQYLELCRDFYLNRHCEAQFDAFKRGFEAVCSGSVLYAYRPEELYALIHGIDDFDLSELKALTTYEGGYTQDSSIICWFWQILRNHLTPSQRSNFLQFVTGSSRAPIGGLTKLGSFVVMRVSGPEGRLPSAHTCFNTLLLPEYSTPELLLKKLVLAINHCQGFGLR